MRIFYQIVSYILFLALILGSLTEVLTEVEEMKIFLGMGVFLILSELENIKEKLNENQ